MSFKIENWKLILLGMFYIVFGFLSYTIPETQVIGFFKISGLIIMGIGCVQALMYFFRKEYKIEGNYSFAFGILLCLAGFVVYFKSDLFKDSYPLVVAACVVLDSVLRLQFVVDLIRIQNKYWLVHLLCAVVPAILAMIFILIEMEPSFGKNYFSFLLWLDAICIFCSLLHHHRIVKKYRAGKVNNENSLVVKEIDENE